MYNPWIGDYEAPAIIVRQDDVYLNGTATYIVETMYGETLRQVPENRLMLNVGSKETNEKDKNEAQ